MRFLALVLSIFACLAGSPNHSQAANNAVTGPHVAVSWLAPDYFVAGETTKIGLRFDVDADWHVYWRNPGDSGSAPKFNFRPSQGTNVGEAQWPYPHRITAGPLTTIGYDGDIAYVFDVTVATPGSTATITADIEWLVCKEECIPSYGTIELRRPIVADHSACAAPCTQWAATDQQTLQSFIKMLPQQRGADASLPWVLHSLLPDNDTVALTVVTDPTKPAPQLQLYAQSGDYLQAAAPVVKHYSDHSTYTFRTVAGALTPDFVDFVVVQDDTAWAINDIPVVQIATTGSTAELDDQTDASMPVMDWLWLLVSAFVGGIILNGMPCVFPVLSLKVFALVRAGDQPQWRDGWLYFAGVLTTFLALGAAFIGLRSSGQAIGWGFQLQSPPIVLGLAILFFVMGLSFLGVFTFGNRIMNLAGRSQSSSSFVTGILAVFVAAPCTGPFMGAALGAAATLPAPQALGIFAFLGIGLALPLVFVSGMPKLRGFLPKPGPWMQTLSKLLSIPMFATALWLAWVLSLQVGQPAQIDSANPSAWQAFDNERIVAAQQQQQAVFIDYTAAWCITCQANKAAVLSRQKVLDLFAANNVLLIRADWTNQNPAITESLLALGRSSVPVYAYYDTDGTRTILPQVLTIAMIERLFDN